MMNSTMKMKDEDFMMFLAKRTMPWNNTIIATENLLVGTVSGISARYDLSTYVAGQLWVLNSSRNVVSCRKSFFRFEEHFSPL